MTWVLVETLASENWGSTLYFREMAAIGPMTTAFMTQAATFETEQAAMQSPAYSHALSCYEPREV